VKIRRLAPDERYKRVQWMLDYYEGSKRIRKFFKSKAEAEAEAGEKKEQHKHTGQSWLELTPEERSDLMHVVAESRERKVTIRQVWEAYKNGKLDATPMQRLTLQQAITETIKWRRGENLRERYLKELEAYLKKFASGRNAMFIDQVGVEAIQQWFDGRNEALSTKRANIGRLGSMFDVAWKHGVIKENPCLKLPTVKLRQGPPKIFMPEQAANILRIARCKTPGLLPYLALGIFVGVRPEELEKLKFGDLDLKHGTVTIDAAAAKTSRRRRVPLHPTAQEWLKVCKFGEPSASIVPKKVTLRRYRRKLRDASKVDWGQDILRHTAGSYLLALHKNAHEVSNMLGNSARILERHYKDLVTASDCEKFWALTPLKVKKEKSHDKTET
jgi:integrase